MAYHRIFLDAFWEKVDDSDPDVCWPWTAARYHDDYGMLNYRSPLRKGTMRAHAFALTLATGEDANGRFALHSCDNPPCCNPAHLRWGNQKDNIADADLRGRTRRPVFRGEVHPRAKLTDDDVRAIRAEYALSPRGRGPSSRGVSQQELATRYGVSQFGISQVVRGKTWRHVT